MTRCIGSLGNSAGTWKCVSALNALSLAADSARMAQGHPEYGPHDGFLTVGQFLSRTLGALYHDDQVELERHRQVERAYQQIRVHDVSDLLEATDGQHNSAITQVLDASEVRGFKNQILKYLGSRGDKHVPPPDEAADGLPGVSSFVLCLFVVPLCASCRTPAGRDRCHPMPSLLTCCVCVVCVWQELQSLDLLASVWQELGSIAMLPTSQMQFECRPSARTKSCSQTF